MKSFNTNLPKINQVLLVPVNNDHVTKEDKNTKEHEIVKFNFGVYHSPINTYHFNQSLTTNIFSKILRPN